VVTVEGLSSDDALTLLQTAFRKHHALQCGLLYARHVDHRARPIDRGTGCRCPTASARRCRAICADCTGYIPIVEAVLEARAAYQKTDKP